MAAKCSRPWAKSSSTCGKLGHCVPRPAVVGGDPLVRGGLIETEHAGHVGEHRTAGGLQVDLAGLDLSQVNQELSGDRVRLGGDRGHSGNELDVGEVGNDGKGTHDGLLESGCRPYTMRSRSTSDPLGMGSGRPSRRSVDFRGSPVSDQPRHGQPGGLARGLCDTSGKKAQVGLKPVKRKTPRSSLFSP